MVAGNGVTVNAKLDGSGRMPRFAILIHDHPHLHWDFLLEVVVGLRAWRLASPPEPGRTIRAEALPDHRQVYLNYEGPVGGGRGVVARRDSGAYSVGHWDDERIEVALAGQELRGQVRLTHVDGTEWRFEFVG